MGIVKLHCVNDMKYVNCLAQRVIYQSCSLNGRCVIVPAEMEGRQVNFQKFLSVGQYLQGLENFLYSEKGSEGVSLIKKDLRSSKMWQKVCRVLQKQSCKRTASRPHAQNSSEALPDQKWANHSAAVIFIIRINKTIGLIWRITFLSLS